MGCVLVRVVVVVVVAQSSVVWRYHAGQGLVAESGARFKVLVCGRRWRKTGLGWMELYRRASEVRGVYWWVAPRYKELQGVRQVIKETTPESCFRKYTEVSMAGVQVIRYALLPNGSEIFFQSADTEDSMRGQGLCGLVMDEAPLIERGRWENELRPSLMDRKGWAMFLGTPKGHNWFYELYLRGKDRVAWPDWESWSYPSHDNPYLDKSEIDDLARNLPQRVYEQEVLAAFLDDVGQVFRNITGNVDKRLRLGAEPHVRYVVGADVAKAEDFQVHVALDMDGNLAGVERFHELAWPLQRRRLVGFCGTHNRARLLMDSTGVGDPIYDELRAENEREQFTTGVDGYKFTLGSKADLVENLSLMLDKGELHYPDPDKYPDVRILLDELAAYGYELGETGTMRYRAPEGLHDDCVVALALAAWQLRKAGKERGFFH